MLVNVSYFIAGPRMVANATRGTESSQVNDYIMGYVDDLQPVFLCELLGEKVGMIVDEYLRELDSDPEAETDERIENLCKKIRHSFADYVFYHILGSSNELATINGVVKVKGANDYASPMEKQVAVWNGMVKRNRLAKLWCESGECEVEGIRFGQKLLTPINKFNL